MRRISIAVTSWNRFEQTVNSFSQILDDDRVSEVAITDDFSTDDSYDKLKWHFRDVDKVKIYRNSKNMDCYFCKHEAAKNSNSEWLMLIDSDNTFDKSYLDAIYDIPEWGRNTFYQPQFSRPHFDFRKWKGLTITKENVAQYVNTDLMTACNAMNFFINRDEYLKIWDGTKDPVTSDSIYFALCWLRAGNQIRITPNLEYDHFIDPNGKGHYQENYKRTGNFHQVVMDELKQLK